MENNGNMKYKYLTLLSMIYVTIKLSTILLIYKIITLGPISFTASTIIIPFWFFLGTIITETYGYSIARQLIWTAIFCQFLFTLICTSVIYIHSPVWIHQEAYIEIFGKLPRVTFASSVAILCGAFINSYLLAKYKILSKGKSFWVRGLKSSSIGEFIFTLIAYLTEFLGIVSLVKITQLMLVSFFVKVLLSPILIIPAILIANKLKNAEKIDIFDYETNFNPFKLGLNEEKNMSTFTNIIKFPQRIINKKVEY